MFIVETDTGRVPVKAENHDAALALVCRGFQTAMRVVSGAEVFYQDYNGIEVSVYRKAA